MRFSFFVGVTVLFFAWGCHPEQSDSPNVANNSPSVQTATIDSSLVEPTYDEYGIAVDSVQVEDYRIQRNESLYLILNKHGFSDQEIYHITNQARGLIDFKSFKPGQPYRIYTQQDSINSISQLVWQKNSLEYVVFDWTSDSPDIYKAARPLKRELAATSGTIENSLYQTVSAQGESRLLANRLANIFAWQINFFGLRPGDSFKALYEEQFIDDQLLGIGEVIAAEFTHRDETYRAYKFSHDEISGFFTEEGKSVQKALLQAPFNFSQRVSSNFSRSRYHPILKKRVPHYGVDYAAPPGTPVLAVGDGTVTEAQYRGANGNIVKITHNSTYRTAYLHLQGFAKGIVRGASVEQGQVIGYVGSTGRATGPHLHYSLYKNDRPVNSRTIDLPSSESVPDSLMDVFTDHRDQLERQLKEQLEEKKKREEAPVITLAK